VRVTAKASTVDTLHVLTDSPIGLAVSSARKPGMLGVYWQDLLSGKAGLTVWQRKDLALGPGSYFIDYEISDDDIIFLAAMRMMSMSAVEWTKAIAEKASQIDAYVDQVKREAEEANLAELLGDDDD